MDASLTVVVAFKSRCLGHLLFKELISQTLDGNLKTISSLQCILKYFLGLTVQETSCILKLVLRSPHSGGHRVERLFGISSGLF